jgi:hypothetical protein
MPNSMQAHNYYYTPGIMVFYLIFMHIATQQYFELCNQKLSHADAKCYCRSEGKMLARFDAPNETAELQMVLKNYSASQPS